MKTILITLLSRFFGELFLEVIKKFLFNGKSKQIEIIMGEVKGIIYQVDSATDYIHEMLSKNVDVISIREEVLSLFGIQLSNTDIQHLLDDKSSAKFMMAKRASISKLEDKGVEYTSNLLNLAIELLVERIK